MRSLLEKLIGVFIINTSGFNSRRIHHWPEQLEAHREDAFGFSLLFPCFVVESHGPFKTPQLKMASRAPL